MVLPKNMINKMHVLSIELLLVHQLNMGDVIHFGALDLANHDGRITRIKS